MRNTLPKIAVYSLDVNEDYEGPATYNDIQGFWGTKEVAILQEYGLIDIFDGHNFEPNKPVTREEMAYVTANYLAAMDFLYREC